MDLRQLYHDVIVDHNRSPRNFRRPEMVDRVAEGYNPLCGDKLRLYLQLDEHERILDAAFEGSGCAISVASASLLTDVVIGMQVQEALNYFRVVTGHLTHSNAVDPASIDLGKIHALDGVREFPSRVKCATLAWHALNSAIRNQEVPVTTE